MMCVSQIMCACAYRPGFPATAGKAQLEYVCLTFSADGKQIASLSGLPDFLLTVWYVPGSMGKADMVYFIINAAS